MGTGSFPGVKRPGRGVDHPQPSSAEVEGRVELYICRPSESSWPVLGSILPLLFYFTNDRNRPKNLELQDDVIKNSMRKQVKRQRSRRKG